jgi:hypothetical protein
MAVTVTPDAFTMVEFDHDTILAVVQRLVPQIGFTGDVDVQLDVDERVPLGRAELVSMDPIVIQVEGGALEDPKKPRHLSEAGTADVVGRILFQARDRLDPGFGEAPPADGLSLGLANAWDVYATGRLVALGYRSQRQRWLYAFRNRHGFTDAADAAFDQLWASSDALTWADIERLSTTAQAARDAVTA